MNELRPAQAVIYSYDMEPIVTIDMKPWFWDYLHVHGQVKFSVSPPLSASFVYAVESFSSYSNFVVDVSAIPFKIRGSRGLLLVTEDDVEALLMKSSWLPGQVKELNEERRNAFALGFVKALLDMRER